jgi:hypothetical protein
MKKCSGCKQELQEVEFHKHPHTKDGLGSRCKKCDSDTKRNKRQMQKKKAIQRLGGKCSICGYDKCDAALDFHHKDPNQKEFDPSYGKRMHFDKFMEEIHKCILVCANCHRELHDAELSG